MKNKEKYDYIIVLCPEVNPEDKGVFEDFKHGLYLGGKVRMEAAVKLYKEHKKVILILVADYNEEKKGKSNYYKESQRTDDMQKYLFREGVAKESMVVVNSLPCTRHNLVAVFNMFEDKFKGKNVALLTNQYHFPRSLLFWLDLKKVDRYKNISSRPQLVSAEDIINDKAQHKEKKMYADRLRSEEKGILDFVSGNYDDRCIVRKEYQKIAKERKSELLTPSEIKNLK
jgi:hypothetical protein